MLAAQSVDNLKTEPYAPCMTYVRQENLAHRKTKIVSIRVSEVTEALIDDIVGKLSIYDRSEVLREILERGLISLGKEYAQTEADRA